MGPRTEGDPHDPAWSMPLLKRRRRCRRCMSFNRWSCRFILPWFCSKLSLRKNQFSAFLDFRVMGSLYREAWFCRETSLTVEMITDEAGAFSEFRGADSMKHQKCSRRVLEKFPYSFHG